MPFSISCPNCSKQYNLPDSIAGKSVRCKQCSAAFVAQPGGMPVAAAVPSQTSGEKLSNQQINQFGIEGNFERAPDIFGPATAPNAVAPLGNYAGEDPGFNSDGFNTPVSDPAVDPSTNPYASVLNNPAVRPTKRKKNKGDQLADVEAIREKHIGVESEITQLGTFWMITSGLGVLAALVFAGFGIAFPAIEDDAGNSVNVLPYILAFAFAYLLISVFFLTVGLGMRNLTNYGRITGSIVAAFQLPGFPLGTALGAYILYCFWCEKGNTIFTEEYRNVVKQTPHITRTPYLLYGLLFVCFVLPALAFGFLLLLGLVAGSSQ